jgi:tRNA (mo5U34)-methyltransferase
MNPADRRRVDEIPWFHQITLAPGVVTPGKDNSPAKLEHLRFPPRLDGKTVLDVGAWDGFFSFEAERRGAARVLATDSFVWDGGQKEGFEFARRVLDSKVEDQHIDATELSPEALGGTFDIVLFLGVLYHLRHPLAVLERVRSVTREMCVVETFTDLRYMRQPALAYYETTEANNDPTNWFGPNPAAAEAMLRSAGFSRVERIMPPRRLDLHTLAAEGYTIAKRARHRRRPILAPLWQGRAYFHAYV